MLSGMRNYLVFAVCFLCADAYAAWVKIASSDDSVKEKFFDESAVIQSGPMAIWRRVNELTNFAERQSDGALSSRWMVEYDCMDHRMRRLLEKRFTGTWATGEELAPTVNGRGDIPWLEVRPRTGEASVMRAVCPGSTD